MFNHSSDRRQIPLWQIAPFFLVPPTLATAGCLIWGLSLPQSVGTFALTSLALLALAMRSSERRPAMRPVGAAMAVRRRDRHG